MPKQKDELITQTAAAELLGLSLQAVNQLVRRGVLRSEEVYAKRLVYRSSVLAYVPRAERKGATKKGRAKR